MPTNPSNAQNVQIGVQPDFATSAVATKILKSMMANFDVQLETDAFFPNGNIFPTSNDVIQEWTEAEVEGILTFTEIVYLLTAALGPATITTPAGGTNSRQWKWTIAGNALLNPSFLSVEKGNSVYALRSSGMACTGFNFGYSRKDRIEVGGSLYGKPVELGYSMTNIVSAPTVELVRVLPQMMDWYSDTTFAGLGTSQIMKAYEAGISLDGLFDGVWPMRSSLASHDGLVAKQIESESSLLLEADAAGLAFLTNARQSETRYIRGKATGRTIEAAIKYLFQVDMSVQVKDVDTFEDADGPYAIPVTFQPIDDGTNPVVTITVINKQLAL